jgi:ATP-dependent Clp protease adaptor protein ClpS
MDKNLDAVKVAAQTKTQPKEAVKPKRQPKYNVLLWDDDQHSYEYVIEMMQKVFGHSSGKSLRIAFEVDHHGVAVCLTTTFEHAELKCQQILSFGRDHLIATSVGSMKSTIERVEC